MKKSTPPAQKKNCQILPPASIPYPEGFLFRIRRNLFRTDPVYTDKGIVFNQIHDSPGCIFFPLHFHRHASVVFVAYPPGKAERRSCMKSRVPESDALYTSGKIISPSLFHLFTAGLRIPVHSRFPQDSRYPFP